MPRVRDLLYRFRPTGVPGAASAAGVPADRDAGLAELEPLLAQLATTERECANILERAHLDASEIRSRDDERARITVSAAGEQADAERAAAAARVRHRGKAESDAGLLAAEREAAELRDRTNRRMRSYAAYVVSSVSALIGDEQHTDKRPSGAR